MLRGLFRLTWLEIKIFLREPLGAIGDDSDRNVTRREYSPGGSPRPFPRGVTGWS